MRELLVTTFMTLDGVMQAPGGPEEDPSGRFSHGGWSVKYWDDVMGKKMGAVMGEPFALLLGRNTYEIFAAHWPHATDDAAAASLNAATNSVRATRKEVIKDAIRPRAREAALLPGVSHRLERDRNPDQRSWKVRLLQAPCDLAHAFVAGGLATGAGPR